MDAVQEEEVERLLSERLVEGFCLLEKSCPACATPLVKRPSSDAEESVLSASSNSSFERPVKPITGVPFCVWCEAHVVTESDEVLRLEGADHHKVKGSILVALSSGSSDSNDKRYLEDPPSRTMAFLREQDFTMEDLDEEKAKEDAPAAGESVAEFDMNKVEELMDDKDEASLEEIEVVHVDDQTDCSEMERQMIQQSDTMTAERLVIGESDAELSDDELDSQPHNMMVLDSQDDDDGNASPFDSSTTDTEIHVLTNTSSAAPSSSKAQSLEVLQSKSRLDQAVLSVGDSSLKSSSQSKASSKASSNTRSSRLAAAQAMVAQSKSMAEQSLKSSSTGRVTTVSYESAKDHLTNAEKLVSRARSLVHDSSKSSASSKKEQPSQGAASQKSKTPSNSSSQKSELTYEERRSIATRVLGKKMMQGFSLTEQQCMKCQMPLMERAQKNFCVVCPVLEDTIAKLVTDAQRAAGMNVDRTCTTHQPAKKSKAPLASVPPPPQPTESQKHERREPDARPDRTSKHENASRTPSKKSTMPTTAVSTKTKDKSLRVDDAPVEKTKSTVSRASKVSRPSKKDKGYVKQAEPLYQNPFAIHGDNPAPSRQMASSQKQGGVSKPINLQDVDIGSRLSSISESHATADFSRKTGLSTKKSVAPSVSVKKAPVPKPGERPTSERKPTAPVSSAKKSVAVKKQPTMKGRSKSLSSGSESKRESSRSRSSAPYDSSGSSNKGQTITTAKFLKTDAVESPCYSDFKKTMSNAMSINPFANFEMASLTPPTEAAQRKLEEEAARLLYEAEQAEKNVGPKGSALEAEEEKLARAIEKEKKRILQETKRLDDLERRRQSQEFNAPDDGSMLADLNNHVQRQLMEEASHLKKEILAAERAREEAEVEARRLADEKRALREASIIESLEKEAELKQAEAEAAMERAKIAIEKVSSARSQIIQETISKGEASVIAEVESIMKSQTEDYHEQVILPSASDIQRERWETLRAEGRSVMTRRMMAGWTLLPELCKGVECAGSPLLLDGTVKQCVVCGGTGNGQDGVYKLPIGEDEEEDEEDEDDDFAMESSKLSSRMPPKEISTPRLNLAPRMAFPTEDDESEISPMPSDARSRQQQRAIGNLQQNFEKKRNMVTQEIGKRMMKGWNLLDASCPYCVMPLMTDLDGRDEICVLCGVVGRVEAKKTDRSIKTWTKGDREQGRHSREGSRRAAASRGSNDAHSKHQPKKEEAQGQKQALKEKQENDTRIIGSPKSQKATVSQQKGLTKKMEPDGNSEISRLINTTPSENENHTEIEDPPPNHYDVTNSSPIHLLLSKKDDLSSRGAADPPASATNKKNRGVDAEASVSGSAMPTTIITKRASDSGMDPLSEESTVYDEHASELPSKPGVVTLQLPSDFDPSDVMTLRELLKVAKRGNRSSLGVDTRNGRGRQHPMTLPSPGMAQLTVPGLAASPSCSKKSAKSEASSKHVRTLPSPGMSVVSEHDPRSESTGSYDREGCIIDIPNPKQGLYSPKGMRLDTKSSELSAAPRAPGPADPDSRIEHSTPRSRPEAARDREAEFEVSSRYSLSSVGSRPRITPESTMRARSSSSGRGLKMAHALPSDSASLSTSLAQAFRPVPQDAISASRSKAENDERPGTPQRPILVPGEYHQPSNYCPPKDRMVVKARSEHESTGSSRHRPTMPVHIPKVPSSMSRSITQAVVVEGGPLDPNNKESDTPISGRSGQSVGSATLDAVLARIEKTKAQLENAPVSEDGLAKPQKLRQLIDNLAIAAEEIEKQDRIEMSICF